MPSASTIITPHCTCSSSCNGDSSSSCSSTNGSSNLDKCFPCSLAYTIAESRFNMSTYEDLIRETKLHVLLDVQQLSSRRDAVEVAQHGRSRIARLRARRNGEVERLWRRFAGRWEGAVREDNGRRLSAVVVVVVVADGSDRNRGEEGVVVAKLVWTNDRGRVVVEETVNLG